MTTRPAGPRLLTGWNGVIGYLASFDGTTFELIDAETMGHYSGAYPDGLAVGPDGALWVLANTAVFRYLDGAWEVWPEVDGLGFRDTASIVVGEDGSVWVSDLDGVARHGETLPGD